MVHRVIGLFEPFRYAARHRRVGMAWRSDRAAPSVCACWMSDCGYDLHVIAWTLHQAACLPEDRIDASLSPRLRKRMEAYACGLHFAFFSQVTNTPGA